MRLFLSAAVCFSLGAPLALAAVSGCGGTGTSDAESSLGATHGASSASTASGGVGMGGSGGVLGAGGSSEATGGAASGGGGAGPGVPGSDAGPPQIASCQGHVYECGDLVDNDGDGLVDAADPDCLGPCDNTENSYFGGIPGQNNAPCKMDCYFDQDTGPGNDDCYWSHTCDPHEVSPGYYPESANGAQCAYDPSSKTPGTNASCDELYDAQSTTCASVCGPLTPNGCDCFGCCELPAKSGSFVWLGSVDAGGAGTCDLAGVADPTKCQPCLPVKGCWNDCGTCELCLGKDTLPPECFPDGGVPGSASASSGAGGGDAGGGSGGGGGSSDGQCPDLVQACGLPGQAPCPYDAYCITGCCQKIPK